MKERLVTAYERKDCTTSSGSRTVTMTLASGNSSKSVSAQSAL
jgi:hypothetical protein